ncbi:MAG TPA: hypothetical protein VFV38_17620, partial [Ktedonobacteraceae bacterium]|nr:hypothetical protein [Ktedonobacteraceae bacterium]
EAKGYAKQALAVSVTWNVLDILARIAENEGQAEEAQRYRRRANEVDAAGERHRSNLNQFFGPLIDSIVLAARGDVQAQEEVEEELPRLEARGWPITAVIRRIWGGERDLHTLVEGMDLEPGVEPVVLALIQLILEAIGQPTLGELIPSLPSSKSLEELIAALPDPVREELIAALPDPIQEAIHRGDEAALNQMRAALSLEDFRFARAALRVLHKKVK